MWCIFHELGKNSLFFFFPDWVQKYPQCGAPNQSPINLLSYDSRSEFVVFVENGTKPYLKANIDLSRKISLVNYENPLRLIVENTGHGRK